MPTQVYRLKNGKIVKGCTTILSVLAKPALIFWGYEQGIANYNRFSEGVFNILGQDLPVEQIIIDLQDWNKDFQIGKLYDKRDTAASAGVLGHAFVEAELKGLPEPSIIGVPEGIRQKAEGCHLSFLGWKDRTKFKMIHSELPLVSEQHRFGGCLDIGGGVRDLELIDLKTSKTIYWSMWLQLAGYGILWDENHPNNPMQGYNILRIGPDGDFGHEHREELIIEKEMFLDLVHFFHKMESKGWKL